MDRMNRGMPVRNLSDEVITKFQSIGPARIGTVTINSQIVPIRKYDVSDRVSDYSTCSLPHDSISDSEFHYTHTPHILISIFIMLSIFLSFACLFPTRFLAWRLLLCGEMYVDFTASGISVATCRKLQQKSTLAYTTLVR